MRTSIKIAIVFIALALVALCAFGQTFTRSLPFLAKSSSSATPLTPEQIASVGLAYRWVATDYATNAALASIADRIQNSLWENGEAAKRPTNSAGNGIWFDAGHYFTNNWPWSGFPSNVTFGFICKVVDPQTATIHPAMLYNRVATDGGASRAITFKDGTWDLNVQEGATFVPLTSGKFSLTNVVCDIVLDQGVTNTGGRWTAYYTNALFGTVLNGASSRGVWGCTEAGNTTNNAPYFLLHNKPRDSGPKVWLRELWIWTNSVPYGFPYVTLSNFHKYSTNLYLYSP